MLGRLAGFLLFVAAFAAFIALSGLVVAVWAPLWRYGVVLLVYVISGAVRAMAGLTAIIELYVVSQQRSGKARAQAAPADAKPVHRAALEGVRALLEAKAAGRPSPCLTPSWERGLSLRCLQRLAQEHEVGATVPTYSVCDSIVKPTTVPARCSYWEALEASGEEGLVGKSTTMVSHAWGMPFATLLSIIALHEERSSDGKSGNHFYFVDVFTLNQHDMDELPADTATDAGHACKAGSEDAAAAIYAMLLKALTLSITTPGRMLVALDPWRKPAPLSRAWCIYELYVASTQNVKVSTSFSAAGEEEFCAALRTDEGTVRSILASVDARSARATVESDCQMILALIEKIGFDTFDDFIRRKLESALRLAALEAFSELGVLSPGPLTCQSWLTADREPHTCAAHDAVEVSMEGSTLSV